MAYELEAERGDTAESGGFLKTMSALARGRSAVPSTFPANDPGGIQDRGAGRVDPGPSVVSIDVEMKGSIVSPAELHIYGAVEGNVRAASLTVCAGGSVKGDVIAETVVIVGALEGRIFGRNVQLNAGACVTGDIAHGTLGIDTAAVFEGTIKRFDDPIKEAAAR